MLGMKEICALLLAGGVGAGSVVGVQQAKPAVQKAVAKKAPAPKVHKTASSNLARAEINDCPTIAGSMGSGIAGLAPLPSFESLAPGNGTPSNPQIAYGGVPFGYFGPLGGGGGGSGGSGDPDGESGPSVLPPTPAVPEPASWAMMVGGLGLVGLALRKSSARSEPASSDLA